MYYFLHKYLSRSMTSIDNKFFVRQVQFVLIFSHQLQVLFRPSCQYPRVFVYWIAMHGFLFLFLFSDFYKARYSKTKGKAMRNGLCMVSNLNYHHIILTGKSNSAINRMVRFRVAQEKFDALNGSGDIFVALQML